MRGTAENPFGKGVSSPKSGINYFSIRDEFSRWIYSRVSKEHARKVISYLDRFVGNKLISTPKDVFEIKSRATSQKYIVVALRNLLNFAEEMDLLDEVRITKMRKVLKVIHSNPDNFIPSTETVKSVWGEIDNPDFKLLFEILACSGLRIIEAVQFLKNFEKDKLEYKDNFARYPLFSIRHTKKVYYAYLPFSVAEKLKRTDIPMRSFKYYMGKLNLPAKYLRKWNYNFLIMHNVPESVADFIQGRASISIGSMHYLAKVKQADYWYAQVADALISIFQENQESIPTGKTAIAEAKII